MHARILDALLAAMRPIARFLLQFGIGYRECSEVLKRAFVEVATEKYGIRGRPTNVSRVAVMTGLTRKEVKRIRESKATVSNSGITTRNSPAEVLNLWFTGPEYVSDNGTPRDLPFSGESASFASLVRNCAGDIPPGAMRTELKRVGAIVENSDGSLSVVKRHFVPAEVDDRLIEGLSFGIKTLASTVAHNADEVNLERPRFQRLIDSNSISSESCRST